MTINRSTKPNDVLETTQTILLNLLGNLTEEGGKLPSDPKEVGTVISVVRELNSAAVTTKKLDIEERAVDEATQLARDLIEINRNAPGIFHGREMKDIQGEVVPSPPKLDRARVPHVKLLPGQLGSDIKEIDLDTFMKADQED